MTCHHKKDDPNCSSHPDNVARANAESREREVNRRVKEAEDKVKEVLARTPNPEQYEIDKVEEVGNHLVMGVQYSSCPKCSFDAMKVMVFADISLKDAIKWKVIDPHFADEKPSDPRHAPSPCARFPGDEAGWSNAMRFAESMRGGA